MTLAELPKTFVLGPEMKKGYFPHILTSLETAKGLLPDVEFYDPDNMKLNRRTEFLQWFEEYRSHTFDTRKDLLAYCISDFDILTKVYIPTIY